MARREKKPVHKVIMTKGKRGMNILECTGINKIRLTENIEKSIIITRGGISHTNVCVGGVDNGSNERLCCPSG